MPRTARFNLEGSWFHVHAKVAGRPGEYILSDPACQRQLVGILKHYSGAYCCDVEAFCVMGNHWHGVICFEELREMSDEELNSRARRMYPNSYKLLRDWTPDKWKRFHKRLFDLSELMRNVQAAFARWYNKTYDRQGRFWADRFKSTVLADEEALLDCMLYVDLNPVRAGLVERPEEYTGSSAYLREIGKAGWLGSLYSLLGRRSESDAWSDYKGRLYYRGSVASKEGQAVISPEVLKAEEARGFKSSGVYRKRLRFFTDGLLIGSESAIRQQLVRLRIKGDYLRRVNPITQCNGVNFSLREQRGHAVHLA